MRAKPIELTAEEKGFLEHLVRSSTAEQRKVFRARLILLSSAGLSGNEIAKRMDCRTATVSKWRQRFLHRRIEGLRDAPRAGKPGIYGAETERRILAMLDEPVPEGYACWNGPLLSAALGDVDAQFVWKVMRKHGIQLQRRRSWCISTDPEFAPKAADIVGLYIDPPENAVVLSMDEKPGIQALERAQGWLKLPNGKAVTGYSHEYKRHGTSNLFAALNVATGQVTGNHYQRRRRVEFLDFMNKVIAEYPGQEIHVILDNLSTHKPKRDHWLSLHKNVHFHYTPTHASWLNQIEVWFSKLSRYALKGASFTSPAELRTAIDNYIKVYNENPKPIRWTKPTVKQSAPKLRYADLRT